MNSLLRKTLLGLTVMLSVSIVAGAQVIYDSLLNPMPGNVASLGFEATSADEFGDRLIFGAGGRRLVSVTEQLGM